ncbi:FAD binding domain-containing protein [Mycena leptocephala]|nr:FAD binding domain-containing protein [Mycena leptocephala]
MALALLRNGVSVRLIDKEPAPRLGQRGAGIMPRSLELFNALGVGDKILRLAIPAPQAVVYEMPGGVKPLTKFDMWPPAEPTSQRPFPNVVMLGQDHLERLLRTELNKLGCETEWGTTLLSLEQPEGGDFVRAFVSRPHPESHEHEHLTESATYDFVVGADGARGVVRKSLGLTFLGETSNADNLVVGDVMVHGLDSKIWHMWGHVGANWLSLRPTEVPLMYNFLLGGSEIDHPYIVEHPEALASIFVEYTGGRRDLVFGDVVWLSHYRMVDKFGVGRVFVAGDSAHVHSITGGQAMNVGIQDSFNLAWKLALVQRNLAPESLLQTYTEERAPVVAALLNQITMLKESWTGKSDGPPPTHVGGSAWKHNGGVLQLGVNCRWSSVVVDEQGDEELLDDFDEGDYGEEEEEDFPSDAVVSRPLSAGDRAPDAPGLVALKRPAPDKTVADTSTTSLFRTLRASHHTANRYTPVIGLLAPYAPDAVQSAIVVRAQGTVPADRGGHAYRTYALRDRCDVVVVRPDGLIGAVVRSREGLRRYLRGVFKRQPT